MVALCPPQSLCLHQAVLSPAPCTTHRPSRPPFSTQVLSEQYYGSREALLRLDMSEYMERHSVSKLVGAPPGGCVWGGPQQAEGGRGGGEGAAGGAGGEGMGMEAGEGALEKFWCELVWFR